MTNTYLFKVNYYNECEDVKECCYGTIAGDCYADAMSKISKRFGEDLCLLIDVFIRETFAWDGFTFLDEDVWKKIYEEDKVECEEGDDNDVRSI